MEEEKNLRLVYSSKLDEFVECNESFDSGALRIAYTGENRNGSYISKETFERCVGTMFNKPVVANYIRDEDAIGGHDMEIVRKDGVPTLVSITQPVGVVPESAEYWWENVTEEDGSVHEYLCADVLLWKRQEAYQKIRKDGIVAESMEISVKASSDSDGLYQIDDFEFLAFCLLGNCEPCFESASLALFAESQFKSDLEQMLAEVPSADQFRLERKVNYELNEKLKLMKEFGLELDDLDFELSDFSLDELRVKFEALTSNGSGEKEDEDYTEDGTDAVESEESEDDSGEAETEAVSEDGEDEAGGDDTTGDEGTEEDVETSSLKDFTLADNQFRDELHRAVSEKKAGDGDWPHYWLVDCDRENNLAICYDEMCGCIMVGLNYTVDGDKIIVDFTSARRVKVVYEEFDEGEAMPEPVDGVVGPMQASLKSVEEKYSAEIARLEGEVETLQKFKAGVEKDNRDAALKELFGKFDAELGGNAEFALLKKNCDEMSIAEVEEKCFAIRGRMNFTLTPSTPRGNKLPVDDVIDNVDEPYGGIVRKYI